MSTDVQTYNSSSIAYPAAGGAAAEADHDVFGADSNAIRALSQLETITASITPSPQPAEVFDSLAAACVSAYAGECIVELVEGSGEPYRLSWPKSVLRIVSDVSAEESSTTAPAAPSAIIRELLYGGRPTVIDGDTMAATVVGTGPTGGEYLGAVVCTRASGFTATDAEILRTAVQHCVAIIRQERHHAATAEILQAKIANLEVALASNRDIGVAMGVLMVSQDCTSEEAFSTLRQASQDTNRKLRDIAANVVRTGAMTAEQTQG
ncbi:MAG: hypothetical protein JWM76_2602 [Pseudonocardiales bacterium]|nr:hypothetical protein [Pseudonocardiales bacterium]